jgi:NitT/TauT family transport system substrate-binding protein
MSMKVKADLLARLLLAFLLLVGIGCQADRDAVGEPSDVTIAMGFIPNVQFAPVYVALEKGYFEEEGINVSLDYGMETDILQLVGTNELRFAIGSGDQVALARANDLPVTYVVNWYDQFPVCIVSMASEGIEEPQDLTDKTVGIPALAGASYIGWLAFLEDVGLDAEAVNLQVVGYTQVASLVEDRVDAAVCYAMNEPVQLSAQGYEIDVHYLERYTSLVSNGLITNEQTIENEPELVGGVVRAFLRGLADTVRDPEEAFETSREAIPEMDAEAAELQRRVLQESIRFWHAEKLGWSEAEDWQEMVAFMETLGLVPEGLDPNVLFTNAFVE